MDSIYPVPQEVGIKIPRHLKKDRYKSGFEHAMQGGHLDKIEYMRLSFREGFRAAKLYLKELRRKQGVLEFPMQGKIRTPSIIGRPACARHGYGRRFLIRPTCSTLSAC